MPVPVSRRRSAGQACASIAAMLLAVSGGSAAAAPASAPTVSAWIRLPAVPGRPAAAYAKIVGSKTADRLLSIAGPAPARLELHTSRMENGVMRMEASGPIAVAPGSTVEMKPGGLHIMIFGLAETKPGARVPLTFVFERAGRVAVSAETKPAAAAEGHAHH
jgi:copper(I)-binding protein